MANTIQLPNGRQWQKDLVTTQGQISRSTSAFFHSKGMVSFQPQMVTQSVSCPGGQGSDSSAVDVNIAGSKGYLSDSVQFSLEYGCRLTWKGSFGLSPSFRNETPDKNHLSVFYMAEAEIRGCLNDAISLAEGYLQRITRDIAESHESLISSYAGTFGHVSSLLSKKKLPCVSLDDAEKIVGKEMKKVEDSAYRSITREGELILAREFGGAVWLTPKDLEGEPFFQSKAADLLLLNVGETIGLGERHQTAEQVRQALKLRQVPEEDYRWYAEMREKEPLKTSGFGMGVERYICWLYQLPDIRVCQFPH